MNDPEGESTFGDTKRLAELVGPLGDAVYRIVTASPPADSVNRALARIRVLPSAESWDGTSGKKTGQAARRSGEKTGQAPQRLGASPVFSPDPKTCSARRKPLSGRAKVGLGL